ncbi:D-alanyl-D-alanine carboxypeptidase/D-alanyl-D-alanine endopeptidase [Streptomyces netropsis]|uniref:D-alanyl-D-alanine carboxypeptidase/D-alanyl-D-alanine-endopeptidase (Penicillin-binding protein 4) n=1 Tax=Streptomyces netropsis TaxID=55404 RepID=A0A7W7LH95_STRNE|nr:D-alanyl-D-alanine carboxypeptidase/D-alanyl-D-alanine-endopeptidase [Streptomyces netropsis]MBB4890190.1 D-alanyl-D-alanine carboxypeptidase/D-alanyl-D-alanine-endopeptidase (penicillin-binding protein 4) [Streptomyces netropsis]
MPEARTWQFRWWRNAPQEQRRTVRFVAVSAVTGLVVATGAVAAAGPWDSGQRKAERARSAAGSATRGERHAEARVPLADPVLASLGGQPGATGGKSGRAAAPAPTRNGLTDTLKPLLDDGGLGPDRSASVVDVATGEQLYGADQDTAYTPASTVKLATAAAALSALGPDHRIDTTVVTGKDGMVLVGGGDPTLTARQGTADASLRTLADATARALKARGTTRTKLAYDTSRYAGPAQHVIGPNENIAPMSALMIDEGRQDDSDRGPAERSADPAADAAGEFASLLRERGVEIDGDPAGGSAPAKAERIAAVSSPPLSALVERTLTNSDNDIAEALARQTALASGQPASFEGAAKAVTDRLTALGLPMSGAHIADGSGLDRADQVSAALLSQLLARAADPGHPELRPVLTGLPVAGFSGTLRSRYGVDDHAAGRGTVRAKTGTLTGVNSLAGTTVDADGRLLAFAFLTSGTGDPDGAQRALDSLATAVAGCGCR